MSEAKKTNLLVILNHRRDVLRLFSWVLDWNRLVYWRR